MRFAILGSRGYPSSYGGFETLVRHLAPYLADLGHEVVVYGRKRAFETNDQAHRSVTVINTWGIDRKSASTLTYGLTASRHLAHTKCDTALVLNVANGFHLRRLRNAGIPTCVNVDGLEWLRAKWGHLARTAFKRGALLTARYADTLIFDSLALQPVWAQHFGRDGEFIPYGADVMALGDDARSALHQAGLPAGDYVLVVARVVPENNIDLLLDAMEMLNPRPRIVVVGAGNYEHETVRRLNRLDRAGEILWLGHVSDQHLLQQLWACCGTYWHGHSVGGTNPALLQALGAGAPTLALDTPFNREVLANDAQLVPGDAALIAERVGRILGSSELQVNMKTAGQAIVATRYRWADVCQRYGEVLLKLAAGRGLNVLKPETSQTQRPTAPGMSDLSYHTCR